MNKILYTLLMLLFSFGQAYSQEDASSMSDLLNQIQQGPVSYTHLTLPTKRIV